MSSQSSKPLSTVFSLEQSCRSRGMFLIVDTDGRIKIYPPRVAKKYPAFLAMCRNNEEDIKLCLKLLSNPVG